MSKEDRIFDLEDRLIDFAVRIIRTAESLPKTKLGNHIAGQLIRCGTSPAPNYGEAQSAESRSDFVHKMKVSLKELRETRVWLLIIEENNELISIFVTSIKTAQKRKKKAS
jgi:four helix bundle protein